MIVYERIIPNNEGVFAITLRHPGFDEREYLGKDGYYARFISTNGDVKDRFEKSTVHLSGKELDKRAALPETIFGGDDGRVISSFSQASVLMPGRGVLIGVLDVITGQVLAEEAHITEGDPMLAMMSAEDDFIPSRLLACSKDSDKALVWNPNGVFAVQLVPGFPRVMNKVFPGTDQWFGAWVNNCWLVCPEGQRKKLLLINETTGEVVQELKVRREASSFDVAHSANKLAVGLMGGIVYVFDLANNSKTILAPHPEAKKDEWTQVKISDNGRYIVSKLEEQSPLVLTDLETEESRTLMELPWVTVPLESGGRHDFIPDFCFIGNELVTLSNGEVSRHQV